MENCEALAAVPYFRGLREEIVCSIIEFSIEKHLPKGRYLFMADDVCNHLFIIKKGLIEIFKIGTGRKAFPYNASYEDIRGG